jgi:diadenosine tetraphosphate (Ap4A) HIT family hydrolase
MRQNCSICQRIDEIELYPYFVAELETGYVILGNTQFFRGYTLFYCKPHAYELHELAPDFKMQFLIEMSAVAEAVFKCFEVKKLNYELLGNGMPHLHWHLFPRHADDPRPHGPVYHIDMNIWRSDKFRPDPEERDRLKRMLLRELEAIDGLSILSHAFN